MSFPIKCQNIINSSKMGVLCFLNCIINNRWTQTFFKTNNFLALNREARIITHCEYPKAFQCPSLSHVSNFKSAAKTYFGQCIILLYFLQVLWNTSLSHCPKFFILPTKFWEGSGTWVPIPYMRATSNINKVWSKKNGTLSKIDH